MTRLHCKKLRTLLFRFRADRGGATAVEFGLVAFPFFILLFAIMQTSLVMFGGQALQTMTSVGSRKIMTGELKNKSLKDFRDQMCADGTGVMFDCDKLLIQVEAFDNFAKAATDSKLKPECFELDPPPSATDCYKPGTARQVVIVRIAYDWPFAVDIEDFDHKTRINAVAGFRNEPF